MVTEHYYNFRYLTNMLKIRSRGFDRGQYWNVNPVSANPTKWSNTLKQFFGNLRTNFLSVFDHFVILALKGLIKFSKQIVNIL